MESWNNALDASGGKFTRVKVSRAGWVFEVLSNIASESGFHSSRNLILSVLFKIVVLSNLLRVLGRLEDHQKILNIAKRICKHYLYAGKPASCRLCCGRASLYAGEPHERKAN